MPQPPHHINRFLCDRTIEMIFHCFIGTWATLPPPKEDPRETLSLVCRDWWELVRHTSAFWNSIMFVPIPFADNEVQLAIFQRYMTRSKSKPLYFSFPERDPAIKGPAHTPTDIKELVYGRARFSIVDNIIVPHIDRIRSLSCLICETDNTKFLCDIGQGLFTALETINITFINDFEMHESAFTTRQLSKFKVFNSLPMLCDASFKIFNGVLPTDLQLPWHQMTRLNFSATPMSLKSFVEIMQFSAPSLQNATFEVEFDTHLLFTNPPTNQIIMRCLQKLHVRLHNPSLYRSFWDLFHLPVLQYFWVEKTDAEDGNIWDLPTYTNLLAPSSNSLEHILFGDFGLQRLGHLRNQTLPSELENLLEVGKNVEILRLPLGVRIHPLTVNKIGSGGLLPRLRAFELSSVDGRHILSMVKKRNRISSNSRHSQMSPITVISLTVPYSVAVNGRTRLDKMATDLRPGCRCDLKFTRTPLVCFGI
ncbi:hypothetical protein GALMADRAFT_137494 [Galerina marginata CBS 339.88]|uniref:F-box domain-containing protein n=1 Tax=Galerina marginata (strain CBS 339.88) TaxID=685588 RepID=A0A067TL65_GALM3|nr:hypothetical protein GALMADRAFT_137494 [Galerina marginata CBS 339.88]